MIFKLRGATMFYIHVYTDAALCANIQICLKAFAATEALSVSAAGFRFNLILHFNVCSLKRSQLA